ncbi:transcriptional regulator [Paenibacillus darwinianus]|uniref:Transcriptional regulator n=1 Tax=Paenibacillus darwinianus TaxID=1380763 RepID=A0A9W5W6X7_9BACL|nr:BlaI/MecI/CopY family transcriptional regulator [Paenibacillus darwinianus]EXX87937.1 transcriptional regulator [Paenibacillus darwinianus]EXX88351.1 transcriptional regulator [Paenibacillus darwinianus]EXX88391.1 transcriptional regulator [Paenibacillus darwinianus]
MRIQRIKLSEEGMNRFFGSLEARIMDIVWKHEEVTIKDVQSLLDDDLSFNTVMTVMNRLYEKGHLRKSITGKGRARSTCFQPVQTKEQFIQEQTRIVTEGLVQEYGHLIVNQLVDAVKQADPQLMCLLEARLDEWKRGRS